MNTYQLEFPQRCLCPPQPVQVCEFGFDTREGAKQCLKVFLLDFSKGKYGSWRYESEETKNEKGKEKRNGRK